MQGNLGECCEHGGTLEMVCEHIFLQYKYSFILMHLHCAYKMTFYIENRPLF